MDKHLVFVYGTLRRGNPYSMSVRFPNTKFISDAKVNGSLFDLGEYPGLLTNEAHSLVIGEVYEVDDALLKKLDEFEATSNYCRRQVEIIFGNERKTCWTYEPDPEFYSPRNLIPSGDWIQYARTKRDPGSDETEC
jgi:gamma-glutamylcyclotransferase (GGCT)/AIG2-like uncharacterized protein YtfP